MRWSIAVAALVLSGVYGCGSGSKFRAPGAEGEFLAGVDLYERGRCLQATESLTAFLQEHPGSARIDDAIYYLGLSRKCLGEFILAREEFSRLLREYPQSEHREEAEWNRALCFHESRHSADRDPEPTESAIRALRSYLDHYPSGAHREEAQRLIDDSVGRLAQKAYENGKTYVMLRRWSAALVYFEKSLKTQPTSPVAPECLIQSVRCHSEMGEIEKTEAAIQKLEEFATPENRERFGGDLQQALEDVGKWRRNAVAVKERIEERKRKREEERRDSDALSNEVTRAGPDGGKP